jgi:hypothetical protein
MARRLPLRGLDLAAEPPEEGLGLFDEIRIGPASLAAGVVAAVGGDVLLQRGAEPVCGCRRAGH